MGNPLYEALKEDSKYFTLKKLPNLKNIDGFIVEAKFQAKSQSFPDNFPPPPKWSTEYLVSKINILIQEIFDNINLMKGISLALLLATLTLAYCVDPPVWPATFSQRFV